ncbi:MAG: hydrogen peroxide-inducible genes activator [Bdellovibrionales bacterium]|nr:hydrogen peroxide-inducible genes activator [Bdellovibrionales bacterium]
MATITQLEYLKSVNIFGHFGRAAQECNVSQPTLSIQIQKLEEELDVIIFDRSKKPIIATEVGKEILSQVSLILKEHKKLYHLANLGSIEPKGDFHLAVIPTLAPNLIPLFVMEFSKKYPQVNLKINEYKTEDIINMLVDDKIDAGLLVTPLEDSRLLERHLFFEPFYTYISSQHKLNKKKQISESDLESEGLWLLEEGHCFRDQILKICSKDKKNTVLNNVEFSGGNLETLKNLVKNNCGYTLLPELSVNNLSLEDQKTHIRKFKKPAPTREVSLVYSRSFLKASIINALEKIIINNLPKKIKSLKRRDVEVIGLK